jgi:hypothetical protein
MTKYLWRPLLCYIGIVLNMVYISEANNCSIYGDDGLKMCTKKCCGLWKHAVCTESCVGFSCERDSQCDGGCCQEGKCNASNCLPLRLIFAVATTAIITFALLTMIMLLWCWLQKKRKLITRNIPPPRGCYVDMDEPYWRVRSFNPSSSTELPKFATNGNVNNGFHQNGPNNSQK